MKKLLKDISQIRFGYYSQETADNGIPYLQAKQFDDSGNLIAPPDTFLVPDSKSSTQLLKDGDIILAGKGNKNFAWCYNNHFGGAIASSTFFVITPDQNQILPDYMCMILNRLISQSSFALLGLGTNIKSIRKVELEELAIPVAPCDGQRTIMRIHDMHRQKQKLYLNIQKKDNELYDAVINELVNNN